MLMIKNYFPCSECLCLSVFIIASDITVCFYSHTIGYRVERFADLLSGESPGMTVNEPYLSPVTVPQMKIPTIVFHRIVF